ncbi:hypothetical protein IscW_ISCW013624 [Ixodes scapularis]|uniref:Uncharacterized protein n=1 Tax=Ixodes scapularis TaxID=6945 RepID=B7QKU1_IXOSC|nr:hypothetical protein IscW_ISCW013624 [Ixodes scapularis]|eukprot:XP_002415796.1 hypothetical protein IscW_ISCW013624 [Ixodes scapularis]
MISYHDLGEVSEVPNVTNGLYGARALRPIAGGSQFIYAIILLHYTAMGLTFNAVAVSSNKERGESPVPSCAVLQECAVGDNGIH